MISKRQRQSGFSLIEVTLAMAVAAFCLIVVLGLLPVGLNSTQASIGQTFAASLASGIVSDLRATPKTSPATTQNSPQYLIPVPIAAGTYTHTLFLKQDSSVAGAIDTNATAASNPVYRATVYLTVVPITLNPATPLAVPPATMVRLLITWPAMADATAANAPKNYSGSYELFTALNRN